MRPALRNEPLLLLGKVDNETLSENNLGVFTKVFKYKYLVKESQLNKLNTI